MIINQKKKGEKKWRWQIINLSSLVGNAFDFPAKNVIEWIYYNTRAFQEIQEKYLKLNEVIGGKIGIEGGSQEVEKHW